MGLSLGTVIVREIAERYPEAVKSMLMVGAITRITPTLQSLLVFSEKFQRFLPFKLLKKSFTFFLVPQRRYQDSKRVFYKSGERVSYDSFVNWIRLNRGISKRLKQLFDTTATIPTVYLTGEDDWLFLNHIKRTVRYGGEKATLVIIPKSGHVCNVDNKVDFNAAAIDFMKSISTQAE
jgi:pimeloyl-ACP methyl ester carboxylesterase